MRNVFLATLILVPVLGAYADSEPIPEPDLVARFDAAASKAKAEAEVRYPLPTPPPQAPKTARALPSPTGTPETRSTDQIIDDLMKEVEDLQSKVVVNRRLSLSTQKPKTAKLLGSKTLYSFKEGDVYEVRAGADRVSDIELQAGESLTNAPLAGDTVRWKIGVVQGSQGKSPTTHVIVKPLDSGIETNMVLTTNRRTYHLRLVGGDWYMPSIGWNYPQDEDLAAQTKELLAKNVEEVSLTPEELNFAYEINGEKCPWSPIRVFDDGKKTYLQMPEAARVHETPALFVIEDKEVLLVNYRVKGDFYIVDRLIDHAQMRVGPKKIVDIWAKDAKPSFFERIF